jgi:hypothetical protein
MTTCESSDDAEYIFCASLRRSSTLPTLPVMGPALIVEHLSFYDQDPIIDDFERGLIFKGPQCRGVLPPPDCAVVSGAAFPKAASRAYGATSAGTKPSSPSPASSGDLSPSCSVKRAALWAEFVREQVLRPVPHRHQTLRTPQDPAAGLPDPAKAPPQTRPVRLEGPFLLWIRKKSVSYW